MNQLKLFSFQFLLTLSIGSLLLISSCNDDDTVIDPGAPTINATEGLVIRGGETLDLTVSVVAPAGISTIEVTATEGTATITNQDELTGTNAGLARISYATTEDVKGTQSITLTITDEQNASVSEETEVVVFAPITYGMALVSGAGDVNTTFIQGLINLDVDNVVNTDATELPGFAAIYSDGRSVFTAGFGAPATLSKYVFNSEGEAEKEQDIIVPGSNSVSSVEIVDATTGYLTVGGGLSRAVQFNPSDMRITGEIDLSDAGDGLFYSDIIVKDDFLFISLNDFGGSGEAKVAVVDRTSNSLIKVISDGRTATLFGTLTTSIMTMTDNGDIYIQGSGLFSGKNSGILRIKDGETDFDTEYFFDLTEVVGGSCFGLYHFGDGQTFTAISENDDNWFGFDGANPSFKYKRIDLSNQTDMGDLSSSIPNSFAASRTMFFLQTSSDEILFPVAGTDEDAVYSYTISTGAVAKKFDSNGGYVSGLLRVF